MAHVRDVHDVGGGWVHLDRHRVAEPDLPLQLPKSEWPAIAGRAPLRVLASRKFLVMIYAEEHALCRISVCRTTLERALTCFAWARRSERFIGPSARAEPASMLRPARGFVGWRGHEGM